MSELFGGECPLRALGADPSFSMSSMSAIPPSKPAAPLRRPAKPSKVVALRERPTIIMTVDDDADLQMSIVDALEDKGFCSVVVADGLEALDLLRGGFRPSVILLDLMMPRMNGWDFRREQNSDIALKDIPVVVTTAEACDESRKGTEFGKVGWLSKPFGLDALLTAIESALVAARDGEMRPDHDDKCDKAVPRGLSS
jgi:CheY-like chemotaxis protein